jgi:putative PIN family toxin of toxin-antitoxin system
MIRAVLDANVVISGMISSRGPSAAVLDAWRSGRIEVVTCSAVLVEVLEKLALPRIQRKYRVTPDDVLTLTRQLRSSARWVAGTTLVSPMPPDPDDTMLFAAAVESDAEWIVTGDKGLLVWTWPGHARIVSPRTFVEMLDEQRT